MAKAASTEKSTTAARKKTSSSGGRKSAYNRFMKRELARLKESKPQLLHTERFKQAAKNWATSPENPKANK